MPSPDVLSDRDIDQFLADGYCYLRGGFPRDYAEPVLEQVWANLPEDSGVKRDDPSTWTVSRVLSFSGPTGPEVARLYTPCVRGAFDDLLGAGRWVERGERTGAWPILLPGHHTGPWQDSGGWHIDGGGQRTLTGGSQALIAIMLFSDIGPGDGGTAIRVGSHKTSARVLRDAEPDGLVHSDFIGAGVEASVGLPIVEAQGEIGDLVLCHGYIVHSSSTNGSDRPRVITNNCITLHDNANLSRDDPGELSPYERSLIEAVGAPAT